ncbi:uncharacterized protein LOC128552806 [Mercenaria mercenaria]|uniref:uncharacterized protein LOC128552806 n=1 Tax=Mercenaria mercenaria TaxID=6596 RepID=UPI00234E688B|nr:uncharacterized protein LOC128552806 [Mercenaria mercenaria]
MEHNIIVQKNKKNLKEIKELKTAQSFQRDQYGYIMSKLEETPGRGKRARKRHIAICEDQERDVKRPRLTGNDQGKSQPDISHETLDEQGTERLQLLDERPSTSGTPLNENQQIQTEIKSSPNYRAVGDDDEEFACQGSKGKANYFDLMGVNILHDNIQYKYA